MHKDGARDQMKVIKCKSRKEGFRHTEMGTAQRHFGPTNHEMELLKCWGRVERGHHTRLKPSI